MLGLHHVWRWPPVIWANSARYRRLLWANAVAQDTVDRDRERVRVPFMGLPYVPCIHLRHPACRCQQFDL